MPATPEGVYADKGGQWYFKVTLGRDPLTGRREQITRRGFRTATDAARARRELLERKDRGQVKVASGGTLTVNDLLDLYLDGLDADECWATRSLGMTATLTASRWECDDQTTKGQHVLVRP